MRTFYFGRSRRLYGALHEARGRARTTGVLLCYPGVQEYNQTHWAFRRLAAQLSRDGMHCLRFDWSCTGDSEGEVHDGDVERWVEDVSAAAEELRESTGVRRVSVVGMRLGALLATRAVAAGLAVHDLVLWDPVIDGQTYVDELEDLDALQCRRRQHRVEHPRVELDGYPFPSGLRAQLGMQSLERVTPRGAAHVALLLSAASAAAVELHEVWQRRGVDVRSRVVVSPPDPTAWQDDAARQYTEMLRALAAELVPATQAAVAA
ncbi:MAG: alpha/beta fold hydrolase [Myxococcaceae bacterium]|nr:alpha/beta fold hydrolase [Myxococcaceae bacterium]